MKRSQIVPDAESVLESGLIVMALGCLGALAVLVFGRASGWRSRSHQSSLTAGDSVPPERHHHIGAVSAR